jgi:hypothetical protein
MILRDNVGKESAVFCLNDAEEERATHNEAFGKEKVAFLFLGDVLKEYEGLIETLCKLDALATRGLGIREVFAKIALVAYQF